MKFLPGILLRRKVELTSGEKTRLLPDTHLSVGLAVRRFGSLYSFYFHPKKSGIPFPRSSRWRIKTLCPVSLSITRLTIGRSCLKEIVNFSPLIESRLRFGTSEKRLRSSPIRDIDFCFCLHTNISILSDEWRVIKPWYGLPSNEAPLECWLLLLARFYIEQVTELRFG